MIFRSNEKTMWKQVKRNFTFNSHVPNLGHSLGDREREISWDYGLIGWVIILKKHIEGGWKMLGKRLILERNLDHSFMKKILIFPTRTANILSMMWRTINWSYYFELTLVVRSSGCLLILLMTSNSSGYSLHNNLCMWL